MVWGRQQCVGYVAIHCQGPWSMVWARQQYIVKVLCQWCGLGNYVLSRSLVNGVC